MVRVPVVGFKLCAGFPSPAEDHIEGHIDLPRWMAPNPAYTFLFRIDGPSMVEARIYPRDLLIVDRSINPAHRHIVVVDVDGERSVKRLTLRSGRMRLSFENKAYPAYELPEHADVRVFGVALSTVRRLYEAAPWPLL